MEIRELLQKPLEGSNKYNVQDTFAKIAKKLFDKHTPEPKSGQETSFSTIVGLIFALIVIMGKVNLAAM